MTNTILNPCRDECSLSDDGNLHDGFERGGLVYCDICGTVYGHASTYDDKAPPKPLVPNADGTYTVNVRAPHTVALSSDHAPEPIPLRVL